MVHIPRIRRRGSGKGGQRLRVVWRGAVADPAHVNAAARGFWPSPCLTAPRKRAQRHTTAIAGGFTSMQTEALMVLWNKLPSR